METLKVLFVSYLHLAGFIYLCLILSPEFPYNFFLCTFILEVRAQNVDQTFALYRRRIGRTKEKSLKADRLQVTKIW